MNNIQDISKHITPSLNAKNLQKSLANIDVSFVEDSNQNIISRAAIRRSMVKRGIGRKAYKLQKKSMKKKIKQKMKKIKKKFRNKIRKRVKRAERKDFGKKRRKRRRRRRRKRRRRRRRKRGKALSEDRPRPTPWKNGLGGQDDCIFCQYILQHVAIGFHQDNLLPFPTGGTRANRAFTLLNREGSNRYQQRRMSLGLSFLETSSKQFPLPPQDIDQDIGLDGSTMIDTPASLSQNQMRQLPAMPPNYGIMTRNQFNVPGDTTTNSGIHNNIPQTSLQLDLYNRMQESMDKSLDHVCEASMPNQFYGYCREIFRKEPRIINLFGRQFKTEDVCIDIGMCSTDSYLFQYLKHTPRPANLIWPQFDYPRKFEDEDDTHKTYAPDLKNKCDADCQCPKVHEYLHVLDQNKKCDAVLIFPTFTKAKSKKCKKCCKTLPSYIDHCTSVAKLPVSKCGESCTCPTRQMYLKQLKKGKPCKELFVFSWELVNYCTECCKKRAAYKICE